MEVLFSKAMPINLKRLNGQELQEQIRKFMHSAMAYPSSCK